MTTISNSHLLSWLKLFWINEGTLSYETISDAFFLNEVFREIDPNAATNDQLSPNDCIMDKVKNWEILIKNIRNYYADVLQQAVVVKLPSIVSICRDQNSQSLQTEIDKTIFLILGSAIQCEKKQYFIEDIINRLQDESIQRGLMDFIKQITEDSDIIINYQNIAQFSTPDLVFHLKTIIEQREDSFLSDNKTLLSEINDLQQQINDQKNQIKVLRNVGLDTLTGTNSHQSNKGIAVELVEYKAKLRKLQNELDEKNDIISDFRCELDIQQDENIKLKEAQMKLINESRRVRLLQDELDNFKESIIRIPIIESENTKLKEKVNEFEYYKARCEELREDLAVISNENTNLLDKIENNSKLVVNSLQVDGDLRKANRKIEELEEIRFNQNLEIAKLEHELRSLLEKDVIHLSNKSELSNQLKQLQDDTDLNLTISPISDQMIERTNAKITRLEIENRFLKEKFSESNKDELLKLQDRISDFEIENEKLSSKISRLQTVNELEIQKFMEAEESKELVLREKKQLELNIKLIKENENRKMKELLQENENLSETILIIRERSEKSNDLILNELEKENSKLYSTLNEANHKISNIEFDAQRYLQKCNRLEQSLEKSQQDYLALSKQNGDLNKSITSFKQFKARLEDMQDKFSNLEVENLRLEALSTEYCHQLKHSTTLINDKSEEDMKQLATENYRKTSQLLNKISDLESDLLKLRSENEKSNRQNVSNEKKCNALQQELEIYSVELGNMSRLESKLKLTEKNFEELESEREQLQCQNLKLDQERNKIDKDFRRMKNQSEVLNISIEQYKSRIVELEKKIYTLELKEFEKDEIDAIKSSLEESEKRQFDSEKKNRELLLQIKEEKRQCTTLREELLNERLEMQSLNNQLHSLTAELEKSDITNEDVNHTKFKQLESKFDTTRDNTLKNTDERQTTIFSNLESLKNENKGLSERLFDVNAKYHGLQQKYEEELNLRLLRNNNLQNLKEMPPYAQYLMELKDDIVKLERQNAHLESEKQFLVSQHQDAKEKQSKSEIKFSEDFDKLQKRFDDLNSENVKQHIEESILKSQLDTLRSDNKNLASQLATNERDVTTFLEEQNAITSMKSQLESQCKSLRKINDQLSVEYDNVKILLDRQIIENKTLKVELNTKSTQLEKMRKSYDSVKHLQESLDNEKNSLADGTQQLINLRIENSNMNDECNELVKKYYKIESDLNSRTQENNTLKFERNSDKSSMSKLKETNSEINQKLNEHEREIVKLEGKIESLIEQNEQLKLENNNLLHQMKSMLMQNQELLTETLQNKQSHFTEENTLRDRLNQLQRHKERLEEKIMEQYKTIPSTKKPKGARNKFLKKAKEMLKRKDLRSSIDQDRKSSLEDLSRNQRSHSCVTILGDEHYSIKTGDLSSEYRENSETSDRNIADSDNDASELDFSGPVPRWKSSRRSDVDNNSIISSVSQRVHKQCSATQIKLIPGSMSMYDRDESERNQTSELNAFFLELHNQKQIEMEMKDKKNKQSIDEKLIPKNVSTVKNIGRGYPRSQSVVDVNSYKQRQLPTQPINVTKQSDTSTSSLIFGNILSKEIDSQNSGNMARNSKYALIKSSNPNRQINQPTVPLRKASLPVTDRVEEEFSDIDIQNDSTHFISKNQILRQPIPSRPHSTVPSSASSKEILQRMQRNVGKFTPVPNDLRRRQRVQTPSELMKYSNNNVNSEISSNNPAVVKIGLCASVPINKSNIRKIPSVQEECPIPPVRKESGQCTPSTGSTNEKTNSKVYYEHHNV